MASGGIGGPDAPPPTAQIGAICICNGMGEPYPDGDYVKVHIEIERRQQTLTVRLSKGAASCLFGDLAALLSPHNQSDD